MRYTALLAAATLAMGCSGSIASADEQDVGQRGEYPTWGNTAPASLAEAGPEDLGIADCVFAAIANWEIVALHYKPSFTEIVSEFYKAGGKYSIGIETENWTKYWRYHGIGGVKAHAWQRPNSRKEVERQLTRGHPLIVMNNHAVLVTGFDKQGVFFVTYGETRKWTWHEWSENEEDVYLPAIVGG
jgi:hypothetical protein